MRLRPESIQHLWLGLLVLLAGATLAVRFVWAGVAEAVWFQANLGYGFMLAALALWLGFLVRAARAEGWWRRAFGREHRAAWCLAAGATVFLHAFEPHVMRVLFDEPSQAVGALTMHAHRTAMLADHSNWIDGRFVLTGENPSFRPYFFSFLVSLLHDLTGFRPANVFIANALLTPVVLLTAYSLVRRVAGTFAGLAAMGLLATLPLLAQIATSGGYDLLNVALFGVFACVTLAYLEAPPGDQPRTDRLADLSLSTVLLLSMTRSESVLVLVPWGAVTLWRWGRERRVRLTPFAAVSPVLLLPNFMVHLVLVASEPALHAGLRASGESFFSPGNLPGHVADAVYYLFQFSYDSTNSLLLSVVGAVGVVVLLVTAAGAIRRRALRAAEGWFAGCVGFVTAMYGFVLTQFWSSPLDPLVTRFALPMLFGWALAGGWWLSRLAWLRERPLVLAGALVLWGAGYAAPSATRATQTLGLAQSRAEVFLVDYARREGRERSFYVARSNYGPMANRLASSDLEQLARSPETFVRALKAGLYRDVFVFQVFDFDAAHDAWRPMTGNALPARIALATLEDRVLSARLRVRISRLQGYRNAAGELVTPTSGHAEVALREEFRSAAERRAYEAALWP